MLNDTYIDVDVHGQSLRFGGMIKLAYLAVEKEEDEENIFLDNFCNTDRLKIMLSHRPEGFYFGDACKVWNVDFILSGHTHGGLIRLPFIGGLYAPMPVSYTHLHRRCTRFYKVRGLLFAEAFWIACKSKNKDDWEKVKEIWNQRHKKYPLVFWTIAWGWSTFKRRITRVLIRRQSKNEV